MNSVIEAVEEFYNCLPPKDKFAIDVAKSFENHPLVLTSRKVGKPSEMILQILFEERILKGTNCAISID